MNVTHFVGNDVFQDVLERWVDRKLADRAERAQRKALDRPLHAEELHVPAAVAHQREERESTTEHTDRVPSFPAISAPSVVWSLGHMDPRRDIASAR